MRSGATGVHLCQEQGFVLNSDQFHIGHEPRLDVVSNKAAQPFFLIQRVYNPQNLF